MKKKTKIKSIKKWIVIALPIIILIAVLGVFVAKINNSSGPKIDEAQSKLLAQKYFAESSPGSELKKLYDLDGGWCYGMMPTNGEESTGGVMLCIDDKGQGYGIVSFMPPPTEGQSIYDYTSALEREYSGWTKFKGLNRWDIKVDI